jgi:hypothetical protein
MSTRGAVRWSDRNGLAGTGRLTWRLFRVADEPDVVGDRWLRGTRGNGAGNKRPTLAVEREFSATFRDETA